MKIVVATLEYPRHWGGVAKLAYEEAMGLAACGHEVHVEAHDQGRASFPDAPCTVRYVAPRTRGIHRVVWLLWSLLGTVRRFRPDFIHCPTYRGYALPVLLMRTLFGIPYSIYIHGTELNTETKTPLRKTLMRLVLSRAAFIATNSHNSRRILLERFPGVHDTVVPIHPGCHYDVLRSEAARARGLQMRAQWLADAGLDASARPTVLVSMCRLEWHKGIDCVMRALVALETERPDLHWFYVVGGNGIDAEGLLALRDELGLGRKCLFLGDVPYDTVPAVLHAADIYVQPSQPCGDFLESFGIVFVEAQSIGLPCIGTDWGGVPEAVSKDRTALLVPTGSVEAVRQAIERLMNDPELARALSEAGPAHAEQFTWRRHAELLDELIKAAARKPA